jgi:integrase/recombinase XerD
MNQQPPDRLLRSFERYLRATNRSERTVGNYLENLHQVEAFLRPRGVRLGDATRADLEDFLADLLARRSAATAATRYKVLRVLYRWLEEEEDAPNPMAKMRPPLIPEQPVPVIPQTGCAGCSRPATARASTPAGTPHSSWCCSTPAPAGTS